MMSSIFENAKFGDKFITRDGKLGIFLNKDCHHAQLIYEDGARVFLNNSGREQESKENEYDIVGKWEEPIDEIELEKLAEDYSTHRPYDKRWSEWLTCKNAYMAGYRKAKEE